VRWARVNCRAERLHNLIPFSARALSDLFIVPNRKLKSKIVSIIFLLILVLMLLSNLHIGNTRADMGNVEDEFSIVQISDTQYLSSTYSSSWMQLANWIVANTANYNIKMVVHTGDIVDSGEASSQWVIANASMSLLLAANVPYTWDAGNHDQNLTAGGRHPGTPDDGWIGSHFLAFNATYMHSKPYWVSDINDGKNTAVQFSYGDLNFLVINLEFHANQTVIDWMTQLIDTHPNYKVIVATHSYLNGMQGYGYPFSPNSPDWENNLRATLDNYSNVFLTMSGHYIHTVYPAGDEETSNYTRVHRREETFFNRQMALDDFGPGADSVRIFRFNMANLDDISAQVSTFDIYSGVWKNDIWNSFSFNLNQDANDQNTPQNTNTQTVGVFLQPQPTPSQTANPKIMPKPTSAPIHTVKPTPKPTPVPKSISVPVIKPLLNQKAFFSPDCPIINFFNNLFNQLFSMNTRQSKLCYLNDWLTCVNLDFTFFFETPNSR